MENIKLSIIVPVYNVEEYIYKCISSLLNNEYLNYEIIIINDGSTDKSIEKCKYLIENSKNIILINQKNKGLSATRNYGLDISRGEYVIFVDSDDWVDKNYMNILLKEIELDSDIVVFGYINEKINGTNKKYELKPNFYLEKDIGEAISYLDNSGYFFNLVWNKLYKKSVIKDIRFDIKINYCEDLVFNSNVFKNAKTVKISSKYYYHYRTLDNSLTNNKFYINYRYLANMAIEARENIYRSYDVYHKYIYIISKKKLEYRLSEISNLYRKDSTIKKEDRIVALCVIKKDIVKLNYICKPDGNIEKFIFNIIMKYPTAIIDILLKNLFYFKINYKKLYNKLIIILK